jgi:hypothetical protein
MKTSASLTNFCFGAVANHVMNLSDDLKPALFCVEERVPRQRSLEMAETRTFARVLVEAEVAVSHNAQEKETCVDHAWFECAVIESETLICYADSVFREALLAALFPAAVLRALSLALLVGLRL